MKVLLIDDNPFDRELVKHKMEQVWPDIQWKEVTNQQAFSAIMKQPDFDFVLTDYQLKWTTGIDVLKFIIKCCPDLPVFMVTDTGSEELAVEAMKLGLSDYVLKTHLSRLPLAIEDFFQRRQLKNEHEVLQKQIQQAQKMESLGLLVSGLAHDFNNLLAGMMGYAQQGIKHSSANPELAEYFQHIFTRAEQGARMTRQLLTFARGSHLEPMRIQMNTLIAQTLEFVGTLLGPTIKIEFNPDATIADLYADPTQLEQMLVNLCINARDAMPHGGTLRVETHTFQLHKGKQDARFTAQPGPYVQITITDTGEGMSPEVLARLFEPFFTTKDVGRGTGLGLSVVYGIIQQHHGFIEVTSQPGKGTCFALYFPVAEQVSLEETTLNERAASEKVTPSVKTPGKVTILVVEDDPDVQQVICEVLREEGYTILLASDGEEGLQLFQEHIATIRLVIADIMMPKMQGKEFQQQIRRRQPETKVLVMSGYQQIQLQQKDLLDPNSDFLQKPFDLDILLEKVHTLININN
ncbi:hybrid sensor histidine kinase/response regulator [Dictyobacter kobayashii]|uniref:histidine kinase n=1 Tax=Dictyobacter kobayashii TaxID=2014872 RepID=A0A402AV54_9CHLR|nr:hybrid sensor histidine kinase/response regulator [Dictyobacter kobayashii]GCE22992.1 hypothetical protein KDK_67920 [Dictyobacter kobayashii]